MALPQSSIRRRLAVQLERSAPERLPVHRDAPHFQRWQRWAFAQEKPIAVDLFCGSGGLSLGLEEAGYLVALSVDNDPWALETHAHNLPGVVLDLDLSDLRRIEHLVRLLEGLPIDLVAGGPPCQPFSRAGRSKIRSLVEEGAHPAQDERAELWQSFLAVVERIQPTAVLMENVPDMALGDDLSVVRILSARLERLGYDVEFRLMDAWRHGVPQHRQRLILVARRDGRPITWPREQKPVTLRQAIGDLPKLGRSTGDREMPAGRPRTQFQRRARRGMNSQRVIWDHFTRPVRDDDLEAFRLMKPGTRYGDLPKHLRRYRSDIFNDKYNRLGWDDLSRSITAHIAKDGYWYIHPEEHRTLSVREAARIQTFPDRFRFAGTRSHAFRQIGNAVPPSMAEAVARELLRSGRGTSLPAAQRPAARLRAIRSRLLEWAEEDAKEAPWRHPGDPWKVLAGIVLADRTGGRDHAAHEFLQRFGVPVKGIVPLIRKASAEVSEGASVGYRRLANAASAFVHRRGQDTDRWLEAADLGGAEEALIRTIGLGEDRILATTPILRVAGRITGTKVADERSLSDGRIVVGGLIGSEGSGPALTAALHALGRLVCTTADPDCKRCPVRRFCVSSRQKKGS